MNKRGLIVVAIVLPIAVSAVYFVVKNFYPLLLLTLVIVLWGLHYKSPVEENAE